MPILLPTNHKIRGLVGSQNAASIHWLVPTSLRDPGINLYTSVVDFIYFRRLVESALKPLILAATSGLKKLTCWLLFLIYDAA